MSKKTFKTGLSLAIGCSLLFSASIASAQTSTTSPTVAQEEIQRLLRLVRDLQEQISELIARQGQLRQEINENLQLTRDLVRGMNNEEVRELQEFLAQDPTIYPEGLTTGFFGPLTERAVQRFQERFGIETVGRVGPITRGTLNQLFRQNHRISDVSVDDDDVNNVASDVDTSQFTPGTKGVLVCHRPPGNPANAKTLALGGPAVRAHLAHGDTLGACDGEEGDQDDDNDDDNDNDDEDTSDTTAPVISDISLNVRATTTDVSWQTNENATSKVFYSTSTPLATTTAETVSSTDLVSSHSLEIGGLATSTEYVYIISSTDAAGNSSTSLENSFTTLVE